MRSEVEVEEVTVRALTEDEWSQYRAIRLAALQDSPDAFSSSFSDEVNHEEHQWRACMLRAHRLLAERGRAPIGVVSVGPSADDPDSADVFGLWVTRAARNTGVAWRLVEAARDEALRQGLVRLYYWVGTQNGRAIGFATNFGFRPTSHRRTARVQGAESGDDTEIALVLPLIGEESVPNPMSPRLIGQPGPAEDDPTVQR